MTARDTSIQNLKSKIQNRNWLREKDSNLYLLVQSQPSCRLDDPEVKLDFGFWILDFGLLTRPRAGFNPKSKI